MNSFLISSAIIAWAMLMYLLIPKLEELWVLYVLKLPLPMSLDQSKIDMTEQLLNAKIDLLKDRIEELQLERERYKREAEMAWNKILDSIGQA